MSYVKTTCAVVGTVTTLFLLYSKRHLITHLLFGGRNKKKRGSVKTLKFAEDDDYTISYFEQGEPTELPSLILFHGFTSSKGAWRTVLENFPDSQHVIAADLPGHGGTTFRPTDGFTAKDMAERMHKLVEKLGLKKYHIGGHSLGGVVGLVYANLFSTEVASLIVICPGIATHPVESEFYRCLSCSDEIKDQAVRNYLIPETKEELKFLYKAVFKNYEFKMPDTHLTAYMEKKKEQNATLWHIWNILHVKMKDPSVNLGNLNMKHVRCPTLVVWGDSDEVVHPCGAQNLAEGIEHNEVVIIPECGHAVTMEKPGVLAKHIQDFIGIS